MAESAVLSPVRASAPIPVPPLAAAKVTNPKPRHAIGRLDSIDLLRGLVMVLMALDHVRDFIQPNQFNPTDLQRVTAGLFLTRWITHFCAPVFVFLAGTSAFLTGRRGKPRPELSRFLLTRGLWLVVLELTLVRFGWSFNFDYTGNVLQVIWAIGWSMVALSALIALPLPAIAVVGLAMIAGHNLLDGVRPDAFGPFAWLWVILHVQAPLEPVPGVVIFVSYPLIPWIGVMAVGYAFGKVMTLPQAQRGRVLAILGLGLTSAFVLIRAFNGYGDPRGWSTQKDAVFTALSFVNTQKYPPSLLYLLMTLGPAIAALALFEGLRGPVARFFVTFGRVPLFFYLLHVVLIHLVAVAISLVRYGEAGWWFTNWWPVPEGYAQGLDVAYAVWIGVVASLYPMCRWYGRVKRRSRSAWLSYL